MVASTDSLIESSCSFSDSLILQSSAGYDIKVGNMKVYRRPKSDMWLLEVVFMAPLFIFEKFQIFFSFFVGGVDVFFVVIVASVFVFVFFCLISSY